MHLVRVCIKQEFLKNYALTKDTPLSFFYNNLRLVHALGTCVY